MIIKLPLSLTASYWDWDGDIGGSCVRISFGDYEIVSVPYEASRDRAWPTDDEISSVAGRWLAQRLGIEP